MNFKDKKEQEKNNVGNVYEDIGFLKAKIAFIEEQLASKKKKPLVLSRLLGKEVSIVSVIALISTLIAIFVTVNSYFKSIPQYNITKLGLYLEPYPTYYWYARYYLNLPVSGEIDIDLRIKDEKYKIFQQIKNNELSEIYMPYIHLVNKASEPYIINRIEVKTGDDWKIVEMKSKNYILGEFKKEQKYPEAYIFQVQPGINPVDSIVLEKGKVIYIFSDILLSPKRELTNSESWVEITIYNYDKKLGNFKRKSIEQDKDDLPLWLGLTNDEEERFKMLEERFNSLRYKSLSQKARQRINNETTLPK